MRNLYRVLAFVAASMGSQITEPPHYYQTKTAGCNREQPEFWSCHNQFVNTPQYSSCFFRTIAEEKEDKDPREIDRERQAECTLPPQAKLYPAQDRPFHLALYYISEDNLFRPGLAIYFPNKTTENTTFRFQDTYNSREQDLCFQMILTNVTLPLQDTLTYDCPFFDHILDRTLQLTVQDSGGRGGLYSFVVPNASRIDPYQTRQEDWHLFHYVHLSHIQRHLGVPVTLQTAPFANLSYGVSLWRCQEDDCANLELVNTLRIEGPKRIYLREDEAPQVTRVFPRPSPGKYLITCRILDPDSPAEGFYNATSPEFVVPPDIFLTMVIVITMGVLVVVVTLSLACRYLQKVQKDIYLQLKEDKQMRPRVLLIYLAESWSHFEVVVKLAIFLRDTCFVNPFMVDTHSIRKHPNNWTSEHFQLADRVVFLVPENLSSQSVTPNKRHWEYALWYMNGPTFNQNLHKFGTVLMPFSAPVPHQIAHVHRFKLLQDLTSFVIWLHNGKLLDRWLFWRSHIKSTSSEGDTLSFPDLMRLLQKEPVGHRDEKFKFEWTTCQEILKGEDIKIEQPQPEEVAEETKEAEDMTKCRNSSDNDISEVFDRAIADVSVLVSEQPDEGAEGYESSDYEGSILNDDILL
ncbi:uncharacterized protein LOC121866862 [Homarus americanus]|uniref:uncharacterized protein LOC121866862 n=1 Tax=Homarus americanus TaxID=6706 RepID=UPI001C43E81E|nr:uncharacterized protein LOC121866862 [Homarus americanus]